MRLEPSRNFTGKLDKTAVMLSGLCLVHCLLLPFLIAIFPVFGFTVVEHETFHQLILIVVIPTTVLALGMGWRRHHSRLVALFGLSGIAALVAAAFAVHALGTVSMERWITVMGGLLLATAHVRNFQLTRHRHDHAHAARAVSRP